MMLAVVLTGLLNKSEVRWLKGLMPPNTRLIQPSASAGGVQADQFVIAGSADRKRKAT